MIKHTGVCVESDLQPGHASQNNAFVGPNVGKTPQMPLQD